MRQPEKAGDTLRVDEVFGANERGHRSQSTLVDGSIRLPC